VEKQGKGEEKEGEKEKGKGKVIQGRAIKVGGKRERKTKVVEYKREEREEED
jgi:hypothetical protein